MISWGTNYDSVGEYSSNREEVCKICSKNANQIFKGERGYFRLYGLSLFPTSMTFYKTCSSCKTRLKVKSNDDINNTLKREIISPIKFKYFWGWLILVPILAGILYLITSLK